MRMCVIRGLQDGTPDSKGHGANMELTWGRQVSGGPHVGLMNFAIIGGANRNIPSLSQTLFYHSQSRQISRDLPGAPT